MRKRRWSRQRTQFLFGADYLKIEHRERSENGKGRQSRVLQGFVREELHNLEEKVYEELMADEKEVAGMLAAGTISEQGAA